jgi:cyclophilin family peptidyl-prolyl cis-trans isomerase
MTRTRFMLLLGTVAAGLAWSPVPLAQTKASNPVLVLETVKGTIEIELWPAEAPQSVARILELAKQNFYRGQRIHWAQPGVVQFGDPLTRDMTKQDQWGTGGSGSRNSPRPIGVKEVSKKPFVRGSVGYAYRLNRRPEDADSQMFILTTPNPALNGKYAHLGTVTKGLAVVDKLERADMIKLVMVK